MDGTTDLLTSVATDSGLFALWAPGAFAHVVDLDSWESELLDDQDLIRHISAGHLVPINIGSDGVFGFGVRLGTSDHPAELTERERLHLVVSSEPYWLVDAGQVRLSGIEHVEANPPEAVTRIDVGKGDHTVAIHLIDWKAEPGSCDANGSPAGHALPDFMILINRLRSSDGPFRIKVQTFDRADS